MVAARTRTSPETVRAAMATCAPATISTSPDTPRPSPRPRRRGGSTSPDVVLIALLARSGPLALMSPEPDLDRRQSRRPGRRRRGRRGRPRDAASPRSSPLPARMTGCRALHRRRTRAGTSPPRSPDADRVASTARSVASPSCRADLQLPVGADRMLEAGGAEASSVRLPECADGRGGLVGGDLVAGQALEDRRHGRGEPGRRAHRVAPSAASGGVRRRRRPPVVVARPEAEGPDQRLDPGADRG